MRIIWGIAACACALLAWQALVVLTNQPPFILPGPGRVAQAWWQNRLLIAEHGLFTALEVMIGLALGAALGALTALHLASSALARRLLQPVLVFTQALPVFALAPILTLWLGYGLWSKVAMAVLIIYFPVTSAFLDGLLSTPRGMLDLAQVMQARPRAILWRIRVPAALPGLASGLRLAAVYAPIGAVIGEWVGSSQGLGYLMLLANGRVKTDLMFAAMLTLGAFSVLLFLAMRAATARWMRAG